MIQSLNHEEIGLYKHRLAKIYREVFDYDEKAEALLVMRIENSLAKALHPQIFIAREGDAIAGFLFGIDFKKENWWAQQIDAQLPHMPFDWYEDSFELNELALLAPYRGRGYGKQLMQACIEQCGKRRILLATKKENNDAVIHFYRHLGFRDLINPFDYKNYDYPTSIILWRQTHT